MFLDKDEIVINSEVIMIVAITNKNELKRFLDAGLSNLYQEVFEEPPYNEKFTADEVKDIFEECLDNDGYIFVSNKENFEPIGFVASVSLKSQFNLASFLNGKLDINNTAYFAEDGVKSSYRRKGISAKMKDALLNICSQNGLEKLLLRTNIYNYKQISAVNKAGGKIMVDAFQEVTNTRENGAIESDKRSFYTFDLKNKANVEIDYLERVTIVRPGGNDTAIVWDNISRESQKDVSLKIQQTYPGVEQVMFVEQGSNGLKRGQMAGGEFCGNATRSFGYMNLNAKDGEIIVEVSGAKTPMKVEVKDKMSKTSIPVNNNLSSVAILADGSGDYEANLEGISFIITSSKNSLGKNILAQNTIDEQKEVVMSKLISNGFSEKFPASGILIADENEDGSYKLEPFVYVRDTGTIYYETGCGSGSTSVGLMIAKQTGASVKDLKITQPSGMDLIVSIDRDEKQFKSATVNGPIDIVFDGRMYINNLENKKIAKLSL